MKRRSLFMMIAAGFLVCSLGTTGATASTVVTSDAGTFSWTITGGGSANSATITFSNVFLTTVNGSTASPLPITSSLANLSFTVSASPPGTFTATGSSSKIFGTGGTGSEAVLDYNVNAAGASSASGSFLNLVGTVTSVPFNNLSGFDFSDFGTGPNVMTLTFTQAGGDIATVIATGSGTVSGNSSGGFSEVLSIPEPTSMALLGIGMTGFLAFRRFFRRTGAA